MQAVLIDDQGNVTLKLYDNQDRRVTETKGLTVNTAPLDKQKILGTNIIPVVSDDLADPFEIPEAQIKEDMVGEVVRLTPLEGNTLQVHLRFAGIKEINRLKMNRFLATLAMQTADPRADREATAL